MNRGTGLRITSSRRLARVPMLGEQIFIDDRCAAPVQEVLWAPDGTPTLMLGIAAWDGEYAYTTGGYVDDLRARLTSFGWHIDALRCVPGVETTAPAATA